MTRNEFAKKYARKSGTTVRELLDRGIVFVRCDCTSESCEGWCALTAETYKLAVANKWYKDQDVERTKRWIQEWKDD